MVSSRLDQRDFESRGQQKQKTKDNKKGHKKTRPTKTILN